jgi:hypothetical protein
MASNDSNATQMSGGYGVPRPDFQIGVSLYALISFASIVGNGLVFAAFSKSSKIRNSRTNYLIVSLSCADVLAGSVAIPLYTYLMAIDFKGYNDSPAYFVYQFTDVFSITASVWHLAFISLERLVSHKRYFGCVGHRREMFFLVNILLIPPLKSRNNFYPTSNIN